MNRFPFPASFQFREDETAALEALFERAFFDVPYPRDALEALDRLRWTPPDAPQGAPASSAGAAERTSSSVPLGTDQGPRHVILCRGPNGIGKTRIFRHVREHASSRDIPFYEIHNYEVEGIPLKSFIHVIRQILRDLDGSRRGGVALLEKYRFVLESLLPEAREMEALPRSFSPSTGDQLHARKVRIYDGIAQLLLEVATQRPLLILVHDLHWGDHGTIELLRYIGRNLQLRHFALRQAARARRAETAQFPPSASGPEVEGFESDEWRVLAPPPAAPQLFSVEDGAGWDDASAEGAAAAADGHDAPKDPGGAVPRLLFLGNYRGTAESGDPIQAAIESLCGENFTYHGELRPLGAEEADRFLQRSIEGVEISGRPLAISEDGIEAIFHNTEGFPSFKQELLRGLFLEEETREHPEAEARDGGVVWTWETVERFLPAAERPAAPSDPPSGDVAEDADGTERDGDSPVSDGAATSPGSASAEPLDTEPSRPHPRHGILRRRLAPATDREWLVLRVLASARRPLRADFLEPVVRDLAASGSLAEEHASAGERGGDGDGDGERENLRDTLALLEGRGVIERNGAAAPPRGDSEGEAEYSFRLWDYIPIVEESTSEELKARIHQRIGEEQLRSTGGEPGEGAYEVYYHLRRGLEPVSAVPYGEAAAERFVRSFALARARMVYRELADLLERKEEPEGHAERLRMVECAARTSFFLKDYPAAEEALKILRAEGANTSSSQERLEHLLLEAEVSRVTDPARGLKALGKAPRLISDEISPEGARLYLAITALRLERQDWKRAINFGLKGISICQKLERAEDLAAFYQYTARAFYRKGDYSHAVDNYQRGFEAAERFGSHALMVDILDELGRVYLERGNYFRSARYLYKALEARRRDHDVAGLCRSYDQLGLVYRRTGDYLKTIENLNRSLHLKERIGDHVGLNPTLGTLGDLYFRLGRYQRAIRYFRREVENSQKCSENHLDETAWLADAFARLGRVYFEIGDLRQAESLCKQVLILASEFKLRSQEADGLLLDGNLRALGRDWAGAEKSLKQAAESHERLGHRRRQSCALLGLAEGKFDREQFDEALKLASKAQLVADEVKAPDLQVRALTIKGNVHRFLKGGNAEKAQEFFGKALELAQSLSDADVLFQLFYSLARRHHTNREFADAATYYGKAESILRRIGEGLPESLASRYFEDRRRKVFAEDLARFRKEAQSHTSHVDVRERAAVAAGLTDRPAGMGDYKELLDRVLRTNRGLNQIHFFDQILAEAMELAGADRGFILRVQNRQYQLVAVQGFPREPTPHPEYAAASQLAEDAVRRGRTVLHSAIEGDKLDALVQLGTLAGRSLIVVPLMTDERIFGGIYLDKPASMGRLTAKDRNLLEVFVQHASVTLQNRRNLDVAIREPLTGFYTPSYFIERLREAYRWFNLHGKVFSLAGFFLPALEDSLGDGRAGLGEKLAAEIGEVLPFHSAVCWGNPVLYVLLGDLDIGAAEEVVGRAKEKLELLLNEDVRVEVVAADSRYRQGADFYFELRHRLLPEECDQKTLSELRRLLARDITIKEAKRILEKHIIERTMRKTGGNITHAARELGIHRPQLSNYLKKYGLKREVFEHGVESGMNPSDN